MAAKKKKRTYKNKDFERRSKASKKGWITRRRKTIERQKRQIEIVQAHIKKKKGPKKPPAARPKKKKSIKQQLEQAKREIEKQRKELEQLKEELASEKEVEDIEHVDWVDLLDDGWLKEDKTIALNYSSLRENADKASIYNALWDANSKDNLDNVAMMIAIHFDIALREVYSFWYSP